MTGLDCFTLSLTLPNCTTLHFLDLNGKHRTGQQFTALHGTDMHRNVSHVDVVYWTRPHRILLRGTEVNLEGLLWIALIVRIQKSVEISNMSPRVMK